MDIKVLGALDAEINGKDIVPTAGKPRQILALLALRPGQVVPVPTLMEELWDTDLPDSSLTTLQTYILQLRRMLGRALLSTGTNSPGTTEADTPTPTAKDILATRYGGYLLQIPPDTVDAHRYEQLAAQGHRAFENGQDSDAARLLDQALGLWQEQALVDVPHGPVLRIETMRLHQSRLVTQERRIDAELRLGHHSELTAELTHLTARHPQHEGLHSQAMLALYRSGRQAAALDTYRRLRQRLIDELGVEPSPQLQRMHQAILTVDPRLDVIADPHHTPTYDLYTT
ncbi:AfsR/SARP family transcriptional regulator [Streptomyces sp. NBC_00080]|uniref:AfsR/SARP family transcriptional regulator n=1 Tax=unclassified Streptomyces TaxID=2593676 RepID=UPI0011529CB1|nr:AfsR/SARP family transcriptional regulator [Streptomyces sp. SLBN-115]TQJ37443.1 DNA-binding SARP family transcriptional activator [Streptomyces sp. SLBN-115]